MAGPQPVLQRQAEPPQRQDAPTIAPEPPSGEVEPANSLLAGLVGSGLEWLLDLVWPDWILPGLPGLPGFPGLPGVPGVGLPASEPPSTPAAEIPAPSPAATAPAPPGPVTVAAPAAEGPEAAPARPAAEPAPALTEPGTGEPGVPAAIPEAPGVVPERPSAAAGPPLTAGEVRARTSAAAAALPHPTGPRVEQARAPIEQRAEQMVTRNQARAEAMAVAPARIAGPAPTHRAAPRPDPGPIPVEMDAVRKLIGCRLDPAVLPPVTRSPRGTLPDVTQPARTPDEIKAISLGERGIVEFASGVDPDSQQERKELGGVRTELGQRTATAPPVFLGLPLLPVPQPPASAPVVDEPVVKVGLPESQRALLAGVVSELRSDPTAQAQQVLHLVRVNHSRFPGGALEEAFDTPFEAGLLPTVTQTLAAEVAALTTALALTPEELAAAMTDRQNEVRRLKEAAVAAVKGGLGGAEPQVVKSHAGVQATVQATAWAANQAVAADRSVRRRPSRTQARVERTMAELREPVAVELARLDEQLRQRERAIADAVRIQVSAIQLAQAGDEGALTPEDPANENTPDQLLRREVRQWAEAAVAELTEGGKSAQARLVADARAQTVRHQDKLKAAATAALAALQAWGAKHVRTTEAWWTELEGQLQTWATDAQARTTLWATQQGHADRLALLQDLEALRRLSALQSAGTKAEADAYVARLDTQARTFLGTFAGSAKAGAPDLAGAMAASMRQRVQAQHQAEWEPTLEKAVLEIPQTEDNYEQMRRLLRLVQPNWPLEDKVGKIHASVTRYRGFDEEVIFEALAELTPLAAMMLRWAYKKSWGQSLEDALHGYGHVGRLSKDEFRTAKDLLSGSRVEGAIGAIHSAISGPGAEMDAVNRIMRSLTPEERLQAVDLYPKRYNGVTLESDLNSQWSVSSSEVAETVLIAKNDLVGASATVLQRTVKTVYVGGGYGEYGGMGQGERIATIDRDAAAKVYGRIRQEVEAEAARNGRWTKPQVEAEITFRSRQLGLKFDQLAAKEWWAQGRKPGVTPTEAAFALASPAGRDLLNGLATNDLLKIDVARIQLEDEGIVADDAALNLIFEEQATRSMVEVQRDYGSFLSAQVERQLASEEPFPLAWMRINRRMELQREQDAKLLKLADDRTRQRMDRLDVGYRLRSGRSLAAMVEDNMSLASEEEGLARVKAKGVLSPYQKLRFSIEGLGTNLPMLRSTMGSMSEKEVKKADEQWKKDHDGESLIEAIEDDTSGRVKDDLVDLATHGAPQTAFQLYAAMRRKQERDRAGETMVGAWLTSSETAHAQRELDHLTSSYMKLWALGASREDQRRAGLSFEIALDRADAAIELQRQALDSVADALANAAAIAAAVVVGVALSPFTGGGSAVVAAAVIGSLAATATSIAVKQAVKGSAYGREELYTDLAVGAVDLAVATLTAGLGNALLGRVTALKAAERAGLARLLARMGTKGLLVRKLGDIAILKGFEESRYLVVKLIGRGVSQVIEQAVQAVPTSLTGALLDESLYRQPGGPRRLIDDTIAGTVHSTVMGLGIAGGLHLGGVTGRALGRAGASLIGHMGRLLVPDLGVPRLPEVRPIGGDILGRAGTPRERLAEFGEWRRRNPEGTLRDFTAERTARLGEELQLAGADRERIRQARRELLSGLPAEQRGQYADLPIRSVSEAEFARLTGNQPGHAHLLVDKGRAVVLVREGAPPGAVAALLPAVQERVFAGTYGLTVESALPPHLRDTPVRIDLGLPRQEIRVIPIPPSGPITGVELRVGPGAHPIDVALHAGEITRVRRWMGRLGEARLALAKFGEQFGLKPVTPQDRARFEAAGEVRKLGPIIEERIRRGLASSDPAARAEHTAQALRLLAQQERARRILTGELAAEPRGYIAQEGEPPAKPAVPEAKRAEAGTPNAARELRVLREAQSMRELRKPAIEAKAQTIDEQVQSMRNNLSEALDELAARDPSYSWLTELDLANEADRLRLRQELETWPQPPPPRMGAEPHAGPIRRGDVVQRWRALLQAELDAPARRSAAADTLAVLRAEEDAAALAVQHWSGMMKKQAGVPISPKLPEPWAGWDWEPGELPRGTTAQKESHKNGYRTELNLANHIAEGMPHTVLKYGAPNFGEGRHGSDAISVDHSPEGAGNVWLWDGKYLGSGSKHPGSTTFVGDPLNKAILEAKRVIAASTTLPPEVRAKALANLEAGTFTAFTVSSNDTVNFHSGVKKEFVGGAFKEGEAPPPWKAGR